MRYSGLVLGYHGCDRSTGERVLAGEEELRISSRPYDWLGPGAYFWEDNPGRAYRWAQATKRRREAAGEAFDPFIIGALIDPGECLDFMESSSLDLLDFAGNDLIGYLQSAGLPVPVNRDLGDAQGDRLLRFLDCAAIKHLHGLGEISTHTEAGSRLVPQFDTVRGLYQEGSPVFPGSMIRRLNHVQWAVRNPAHSIRGYFRVPQAQWGISSD